ncbi:Calmodulin [Caenorhabditis elegans]|uniref:Calmodulin n=1 Tax=Caenorhabditis elegans TaxID=6239 RepID=A0A2K5AU12_CAEEL|nr:Calmodulin [Caenorhabditis elegans]SPC48668.2 Calmodulin [Caenorhabditis elegans]|eukprot:NP_001348807.2 Uncharacterized protein CELE_F43C9.2 [Caenorhabditis elegans]
MFELFVTNDISHS